MNSVNDIPNLTTRQAAQVLAVSKGTLDQWRHHGKGPTYFRVGGLVRYRKEDLLDFIERVETPAANS